MKYPSLPLELKRLPQTGNPNKAGSGRAALQIVRLPDPWNWETIYYTSKQIYLHSDQDLVPRVRGGDCSQPTPEKVQDDFSEPDHPRKLIS